MTARQVDAILFDFDGVLADTEPIHFQCWAEVLRPLGIQLDWPTFARYCVGIPDPQVVEFLCRRNSPPVDVAVAWAQAGRKRELFRARMLEAPPLTPAVISLVRSLAGAGYRLAVVTASARGEIEPVLERAGIRPCFGAVVCREDVEREKPAPDPYLKAAALLGASRPLVVEDSDAGAASGQAAGFEVLRVASPGAMPSLLLALLSNFR
jgi:beta-phosphoglucomutase